MGPDAVPKARGRSPIRHALRPEPQQLAGVGNRLGKGILAFFSVLAVWGLSTSNPWLSFIGFLIPPLLFRMLWRDGEPPVLLFASTFQWLQAFCPVISANLEGVSLEQLFEGPELAEAAWLSIGGVVTVALGISVALGSAIPTDHQSLTQLAQSFSRRKLFVACMLAQVVSVSAISAGQFAGGLRQVLVAVSIVKWLTLFLICWTTIRCRRPPGWMIVAVSVELVIGFSGYFSQFKMVLFLLLIVATGAASSRKRVPLLLLTVVSGITVCFVMFWQAVKIEYRGFLNQGSGMQVVSVPFNERISFLAQSALSLTGDKLSRGLIEGIDRLGYINYFAHSITYVPAHVPHENGALWMGAVTHTLMPRMLFPNKPVLDASSRTMTYTGLVVAGRDRGTSISIGFIGESYIDFGCPGMFAPLFLLGFAFGKIYRVFRGPKADSLLGMASATAIIMTYGLHIEMSNISMIGGIVMTVAVLALLHRFYAATFIRQISRPGVKALVLKSRTQRNLIRRRLTA